MTNPELEARERLEALAVFRRTQWLWRGCLCLPFCYLGVAWLVERIWFTSGLPGFWPLNPAGRWGLLVLFAGLAVGIQAAVIMLRRRFAQKLAARGLPLILLAELYWKRTLYLIACADAVCDLGLIFFLVDGNWTALAAFCGVSYLLYAQAYPREEILCRDLGIS